MIFYCTLNSICQTKAQKINAVFYQHFTLKVPYCANNVMIVYWHMNSVLIERNNIKK